MLTLESLMSTRDLVATLADKGIVLKAAEGSPLFEAFSATPISGYPIYNLSEVDTLPEKLYIKPSTADEVQAEFNCTSLHSAYVQRVAGELGHLLAKHVNLTTTVVLPAVDELRKRLEEIQVPKPHEGHMNWNIEMSPYVDLFDIPAIVDEIDKFEEIRPRDALPFNLDYPTITDEELVELIRVGSGHYDSYISDFVKTNGLALLRDCYETVFTAGKKPYDHYDQFRADKEKGMVRNIMTFLVSTRLLIDDDDCPTPTGETGLSNGRRKMALKSFQEVSGASLYAALDVKRKQEKQGRLVEMVDGKTIYVNKSVYDRYISEGGDVELILGAVVSGNKAVYVKDLSDNTEKYRKNWNLLTTTNNRNKDQDIIFNTRYAICDFVREHIRGSEDPVIKQNAARIVKNTEEFVKGIYKPEYKNPTMLALKSVCCCIYNHTDSLDILVGVNEALAENPEIDIQDALNMSMVQYVANWFASQIEVGQ